MRPGLEDVGADLNAQFDALYARLEGKGTVDEAAFRAAAFRYFDSHPHPDSYFSNFTPIGLPYLTTRLGGLGIWEWALGIALDWEAATGKRLHKGTGYYFAGMRDVALGDLIRGWLYMHQAVIEDQNTSGHDWPDTPAVAFVMLNGAKVDQAYREKVLAFEADLAFRFVDYARDRGSTFTFSDYRARLARHADLLDVQVALAYVVAQIASLRVPSRRQILKNAFASLLLSEISFKLCLVIDEVLRRAIPTEHLFLGLAAVYSSRTGLGLTRADLGNINGAFTSDFAATLSLALAGSAIPAVGPPLSPAQRDLAIAYGMRNRSAHGLERPDVIASNFEGILEAEFFAFLRAVEMLYP